MASEQRGDVHLRKRGRTLLAPPDTFARLTKGVSRDDAI